MLSTLGCFFDSLWPTPYAEACTSVLFYAVIALPPEMFMHSAAQDTFCGVGTV